MQPAKNDKLSSEGEFYLGGILGGLIEMVLARHGLHVVGHVVAGQCLLVCQVVRLLHRHLLLQIPRVRQRHTLHLHHKSCPSAQFNPTTTTPPAINVATKMRLYGVRNQVDHQQCAVQASANYKIQFSGKYYLRHCN